MNTDRLRQMADDMQKDIDNKLGPRRDNTPKRQREAMSARIDGRHLQRIQEALRKIADHKDAGTLPPMLESLKTKSALSPLLSKRLTSNGYYHIAETDEYNDQSPIAVALRAFLRYTETPEQAAARLAQQQAHKVEELEQKIRFAKIDGFFPTPRPLIDRMLYEADVQPGMSVLEPSAGKGDIAEAVREAGASVICVERNFSLVEILCAKGFEVDTCRDFLAIPAAPHYDRVIMNPPFERGADADHVAHAFQFLKPGGILVAIMCAGTFNRDDRRCRGFRDWLSQQEHTTEELPPGSFKNGFVQTGVSTVLVCIQAPGGEETIEDQAEEPTDLEPTEEDTTMEEQPIEEPQAIDEDQPEVIEDPEPFQLDSTPVKTPKVKPQKTGTPKNRTLFSGLDCLPGQIDLIDGLDGSANVDIADAL